MRDKKAQAAGFAAGRALQGKDGLLAGIDAATGGRDGARSRVLMGAALAATLLVPNATESAVANGDTRTVTFSDQHTNEQGSFTYMVNGVYDQATLDKLNWFMRDWRLNEPTKMDPHLFDIIWEVYRESGSTQPIDVLSGYRSPQTNAMLHRRSRQVAEHSQHMLGKAIDAHFIDVSTARIRDIAMRMQGGGVGFYPTGITPWVHIDSGSVRYWPRMNRDALTRLFPDGKTVFIPSDGQPMPGYEQARAEIEARGGAVQVASGGFGIFSWLFGGGADDAEEGGGQEAVVANGSSGRGGRGGVQTQAPPVEVADVGPEAVARAKRRLPTGQTYAGPTAPAAPEPTPEVVAQAKRELPTGPAYASAVDSAPTPPAKPQVVAALEQEADVATDTSTTKIQSLAALAPMPPKRPADFGLTLALAAAPMPPSRPANLVPPPLPPAPPAGSRQSDGAGVAELRGLLPHVIMRGVDGAPTGALALAEAPSAGRFDDSALLARAAELAAPLPPMPIPDALPPAAPQAAAIEPAAKPDPAPATGSHAAAGPQPQSRGFMQTAAEDIASLFGGLPFGAFKNADPAPKPNDLRGAQ